MAPRLKNGRGLGLIPMGEPKRRRSQVIEARRLLLATDLRPLLKLVSPERPFSFGPVPAGQQCALISAVQPDFARA